MHELFLQRCCDIAMLGDARVSPNPRVGAVLVHEGRIIGEGCHLKAGEAHAEVNCVASVRQEDRHLISASTIYVSLEPCCFHGRTPACTSLILKHNIPKVVIGQRDKTAAVNGQGISILQNAGVEVIELSNFKPAEAVVAPRQLFAADNRPFILLKFAQSRDGFLAPSENQDYWITNKISRRLVHFWRSRTSAVIIGAGTLLADNPKLNTRLYPGPQPIPVIVDPRGKIRTNGYALFNRKDEVEVVLLQPKGTPVIKGVKQFWVDFPVFDNDDYRSSNAVSAAKVLINQINKILHQLNCNHVTIEGGAWLLSQYIAANFWDEARIFTANAVSFGNGVKAPPLSGEVAVSVKIGEDTLERLLPAIK